MRKLVIFLPLLLLVFSCSNDGYDTGDGELSYMRADFVEAQTNSSALIYKVETDDGETLTLTKSPSATWATKRDTVYRALLYYNKVLSSNGTYQAEPISISQIAVPHIYQVEELEEGVVTDPVSFSSAWKSKNGKYINLNFYIKVGTADGNVSVQSIGVVYDGTEITEDGRQHVSLRLYHSQNGVPEYYSAETYISIPVSAIPGTLSEGDDVEIHINTYEGEIAKTFQI